MATISALPSTLRHKLAAAAWRVRFLRAVRGVSTLLLVLLIVGGVAVLADSLFNLPALARGILFAAWLGTGAVLAVLGLVLPLFRPLDATALACLVEEKYPDLGERLTTAVELADHPDAFHGSPTLIALLWQETEARTHPLDFLQAVPARFTGMLAGSAALLFLFTAAPAFVWPERFSEETSRFLLSWVKPVTQARYAFDVTPGNDWAAQGRPISIKAVVRTLRDGVELPARCTLLVVDEQGRTTRERMLADRSDAFSFHMDKVPGTFTYQVEASGETSEPHTITAIEPVELVAGSPAVTVTPPEYARNTIEVQTLGGLFDFTALQHSMAVLEFRFTRPALKAVLEWKATSDKNEMETRVVPLAMSAEGTSARAELPLATAGTYRLMLEAEQGIRTTLEARQVSVKPDEPPAFMRVTGGDDLKAVLPYESIPVEITVADDIGVERAELEYRVGEGPSRFEPFTLEGQGTREAAGKLVFQLGGKVKAGDLLQYRIKAADNRRVPEAKLEPHVIYHPADRWRALKIVQSATPLKEQEILAQRDDLNKRLEALKAELQQEQRNAYKQRQESRTEASLNTQQKADLKELRKHDAENAKGLRELARDAGEQPAFQQIAERAQDVADQEMRRTAENLGKIEKEAKPENRDRRFVDTDKELTSAIDKLENLRKLTDRLAQERLDQMRLEQTAEREQQLADRAKELAAKDPVKDDSTKKDAEELRNEQRDIANELQKLADQNEQLRRALDAARAEEAQEKAAKARELAQAERDLAEATKERQKQDSRLAELAKQQQKLADKAEKLARETTQAAQAARSKPLNADDPKKAADNLKEGDIGEALRNQDQAARDLDRVARELGTALDLAKDPKEAAKQLARLEEALTKKLDEEQKKAAPLGERAKPLQKQQEAIKKAAEQLAVGQNQAAKQDQKDAVKAAQEAAQAIPNSDPAAAKKAMEQTKQALEKLANDLPSMEERRRKAQQEIAELRRKQDEVGKQAEQAVKQAAKDPKQELGKQLADATKKQAEVAERLSKVDAPNQEPRRERTQEAVNQAMDDLKNARPQDLPASQDQARRELEKLEQALAGHKPAEETEAAKADRLAKKQADMAKEAERLAKKQEKASPEAQRQQQRLANEAKQLRAGEQARAEKEKALEALSRAQQADKPEALAQASKQAAEALKNLADKLNREQSAQQATAQKSAQQGMPEGLPTRQQSEQARQLAQEQRELREAVQKLAAEQAQAAAAARENPLGELAKEQEALAKQAGELARNVGQEQGKSAQPTTQAQQAAKSAQQTARQLQAAALPRAQESGKQTAQQLRQLAQQLSETPAKNTEPQQTDPLQQARQLAQKQEEINRKMEPLAQNAQAQQTQQQARQQDLQRQTAELGKEFGQLSMQMARQPQAAQAAAQAAQATEQAQSAMQQAQRQGKQANQGQQQQSQQQAARDLDRAARQAEQAAQQMAQGQQGQPQNAQAGKQVQQAQGQMNQAQQQLSKGQNQSAQQSMQQAAQSLQQAAQQMAQQQQQQQQPGKPNLSNQEPLQGVAASGMPDLSQYGADAKKYAGKRWGELPGELQTKIIQDMKAKYGDDYARIIKLYFEQIAETKK